MPKYKDVVKQKEFKKTRIKARLKSVSARMAIKHFFKFVYGVEK